MGLKPQQQNGIRGLKRIADLKVGERLFKHGLLVLFFSFVLDTASSWAMMTLRGVSSESNATMRLLFQQRTGQVLMTWLVRQYAQFLFLLLGILGLVFLDLHRRLQSGIAKKVVSLTFRAVVIYGVIFTWIPGVLRYIHGVGSNIAGLLFPLEPYAQIVGAVVVIAAGIFVIIRDFDRQLSTGSPEEQPAAPQGGTSTHGPLLSETVQT